MNQLILKLFDGIKQQEKEDAEMLHLTAYDNQMSHAALSLLSSRLSYRYNLGSLASHGCTDPGCMGEFLFKGLISVYEFEKAALKAASTMFHSVYTDFRPLSGMHAMIATLATFTNVGDTVYSVDCDNGGHFATHYVIERLGRIPCSIPVNLSNLEIDLSSLAASIQKNPAKLVYFDIGCPLFPLPIKEIRNLVGNEVIIAYDASHTQGLIAGGEFQSPLIEGADILQGNTHKTFPGPQKAMIHFRSTEHAEKLSEALTRGLISSQHTNNALALYLTVLEMLEFGKPYAKQMLLNARKLAQYLFEYDIDLVNKNGVYTNSHVLLIKGNSVGGHVEACKRLYQCNIATNSRHGFGQEIIRLGVQEVTRRGMKEEDMKTIATFFKKVLKDKTPIAAVKKEVIAFNHSFNNIEYSFDDILLPKQ